jgi:hypothetical protein
MKVVLKYLLFLTLVYKPESDLKAQQRDSIRTITADTLPKPIIQILYGKDILTKELLLKENIHDESIIPLAYLIINQNPEKYTIRADSLDVIIAIRENVPRRWINVRSDDAVFLLRWPPNTPLQKGTKIVFGFYYSYYDKNTKTKIGKRFSHQIIAF